MRVAKTDAYRRMVKPRWARIIATLKAHTKTPIFHHSCGALVPFIPDLIELGVDIIHPVHNIQPLVPPEDVVALFEAALEFGRYPIA